MLAVGAASAVTRRRVNAAVPAAAAPREARRSMTLAVQMLDVRRRRGLRVGVGGARSSEIVSSVD